MLDFDSCYRAVSARDARFDGRFFTGVTTTGIYCRPVCPARTPARGNVRFYPDAAAAEAAGFRPCKRCRPETSPGSRDWDFHGDLVRRALRLIDDGYVDEHGVRALAGRMAVTERHLHRVFVSELGAPPLAVARSRRLRLARRLLVETPMPVTDVAFAAGFGSVRQFNSSMRETYRQTPSELRGSRSYRPCAGGGLELKLAYRPPYDKAAMLGYLAARAIPGVEKVTADRYARTAPGGVIELLPNGDHVLLRTPATDLRGLARTVARGRRLFDLDAEPHAVREALAADPLLEPLVAARPGLRVPGAYDGFELAVRAVLGQQVSVAGASTLAGRLVARCGVPLPDARDPLGAQAALGATDAPGATDASARLGLTHLFPTAAAVAEADLSGLGLTGGRRRTLHALAAAVAAGELDLDGGGDRADTAARLLALPGIGPWTAAYIAMRALGDPDAFPVGDLGLRRSYAGLAEHVPGAVPEEPANDKAVQAALAERAEKWRPWRAYAAAHLWAAKLETTQ